MTSNRQHHRTHLFTVRLWIEANARDGPEVRGRVQHVLSQEVCYFRRWSDLVAFCEARLDEARLHEARLDEGSVGEERDDAHEAAPNCEHE